MFSQSTSTFTYPGTNKVPSPSVYGGYNYFFESGWVITICDGGTEESTLCFMGFKGLIHDIGDFIDCGKVDYDDKRFLNIKQIRELFDKVGSLPPRAKLEM